VDVDADPDCADLRSERYERHVSADSSVLLPRHCPRFGRWSDDRQRGGRRM